jgi:hypothetical protein
VAAVLSGNTELGIHTAAAGIGSEEALGKGKALDAILAPAAEVAAAWAALQDSAGWNLYVSLA